jgi:hypothetical protein
MKADWGSILGQSSAIMCVCLRCIVRGAYFGDRGGKSSGMCVRGLMQNEFVRTGENSDTLWHGL